MNKKSKCHDPSPSPCQSSLQALRERHPAKCVATGSSTIRVKAISQTESKSSRSLQKAPVKVGPDVPAYDVPARSIKCELDAAQHALLQAEARITELNRALAGKEIQILRMKQDLMLDHVMREESNLKKLRAVQKEKHGILRYSNKKSEMVAALQSQVDESRVRVDLMTDQYKKACTLNEHYVQNEDHFHAVIRTLRRYVY